MMHFTLMMLLAEQISDCQQLARLAEQAGVDVVSFTAPSYFKPANVDQLAKCCVEIARAAPNTAFYYYHIPVLTGGNFHDRPVEAD
jgi:N-acetylneuraminate lyase